MPQDFFKLKDTLVAQGRTFTSDDLAGLAYRDLQRAAIGDAGAAACELTAVHTEVHRRLLPWLAQIKTKADFLRLSPELANLGMLDDAAAFLFTRKHILDVPAWSKLSPRAKLYFRIRCFRAHDDAPVSPLRRLKALAYALSRFQPENDGEANLKLIVRLTLQAGFARVKAGDFNHAEFAARLKGYQHLLKGMTVAEQTICLGEEIQGFKCPSRCFFPRVPKI